MSDENLARELQPSADAQAGRRVLREDHELLLRQVHPTKICLGVPQADGFCPKTPQSNAFAPNSGDANQLSVARQTKTTPKESFEHYTILRRRDSAGVWGFSLEDVRCAKLESYEDPLPDDDAHALVDFNLVIPPPPATKGQIRRAIDNAASYLRDVAVRRGCLQPVNSSQAATPPRDDSA